MAAASEAYQTNAVLQFFSFEGRVPRVTFWINAVACTAINMILTFMFVETYVHPFTLEVSTHISSKPLYYMVSLVVVMRWLSVVARRWHDLNKSGWLAIIGAAPVFGMLFPGVAAQGVFPLVFALTMLVALGFLGFVPGEDEVNDYGPPPDEVVVF